MLSPRELAEALGISESSVKRWIDAGRIRSMLTAGGHRRIPLDEAIRFARASRRKLASPAALGLTHLAALGGGELTDPSGPALDEALASGRGAAAIELVQALYAGGVDPARLLDGPIREALARVGERWRDAVDEGVLVEHRATRICEAALHRLRGVLPALGDDAPMAVGAAIEGDSHSLPSLAAATVIESAGFRTVDLGAGTPMASLALAVRQHRPRLVWLTIGTPAAARAFDHGFAALSAEVDASQGALIFGGRASDRVCLPENARAQRGGSMVELAAFASGIVRSLAR